MVANIGFTALLLSLMISLLQPLFILNAVKSKLQNKYYLTFDFSFLLVFILSLISFLCLIYSYVISDFSISNVYQNSHTLKPLIYKISGSWGNHEGSMLMLYCILNLYSCGFAFLSTKNNKQKIITLISQSLITLGIGSFIVFTSNPFLTIFPIPNEGLGLNPILQDIGLAFHPPMLYLGYIGFSLVFSMSISALLTENIDKNFAKRVKPWLMFSWSFLTLGIGLGSWWAYRELGWGGFWFWDPVENVSLMPWLCGVALIHSITILSKNNHFKIWSCFLSILSFILCLLGIFLVRSGIITSVHSFANDPSRGIFIIGLLLLIGGIGFFIFFIKSMKIKSSSINFPLFSRLGMIMINNFISSFALFIVVLGTLYPLIAQLLFNSAISVGPSYYNKMFAPLAVVILCLMTLVPSIRLNKFSSRAMLLSHIGIIMVIIAISLTAVFSKTKELNMQFGDKTFISGYEVIFNDISFSQEKNYVARQGNFTIKNNGKNVANLFPELRLYPQNEQTTVEADIKYFIFSDLYIVIGGKDDAENYAVRIYHKPFMSFIWLGILLIFLGSLSTILNKLKFNKKTS